MVELNRFDEIIIVAIMFFVVVGLVFNSMDKNWGSLFWLFFALALWLGVSNLVIKIIKGRDK